MVTTDAIYEGTREVRTFVDLAHGADVLIQKTVQEPEGSYYTTMSALLLTAFTFEAYLNHLGEHTIKFWEEIESIKVMDKYTVLCTNVGSFLTSPGVPIERSKRYLSLETLLHMGKSKIVKETKEVAHTTILMTTFLKPIGRSTLF